MAGDYSERLRALTEHLEKLRETDISHEELGPANGFHDSQDAKQSLLAYLSQIITRTESHQHTVNAAVLAESLKHISGHLGSLDSHIEHIEKTIAEGIHKESFPSSRESINTSTKALEDSVRKALHTFEMDLQLAELQSILGEGETMARAKKNAADSLKAIQQDADEAKRILGTVRTKIMHKGVSESTGEFDTLRSNHATGEARWFWAFVVASVASIAAFWYVAFGAGPVPADQPSAAIGSLFRRLLIISAPLVFLKITLTKYNVERNLHIVYDHRQTVLQQYENFENAIGDDMPAKNALRLEVARFIFSDPQTGYLGKDGAAKEISVNPVINMAEKMAKSLSQPGS